MRKHHATLTCVGLLWICLFSLGLRAQTLEEANSGGTRELFVRLNESSQQRLSYESDPNNFAGEHTQPPVDQYMLTRLTPGKQYRVTIEKVDGSVGSGFTVFNRATGNQSLYTTYYEETFTADRKYLGPVQIFLLDGPTSYIVNFVTLVYKIGLSPLDPLERNDFIGPVNFVLPDGSLIRLPSEKTVYLIERGRKRGFPSPYHFDSWFLGQWDRIILVSPSVLNSYPTVAIMPFRDGTLLKYLDKPGDKTVFIIENGQRRAFTSWEDFISMGHSALNIMPVPATILDGVSRGPDVVKRVPIRDSIRR